MARSKVATRARRADVTRRDLAGQGVHSLAVVQSPPMGRSRAGLVAGRDLLEQFLVRLTADERALSDGGAEGELDCDRNRARWNAGGSSEAVDPRARPRRVR